MRGRLYGAGDAKRASKIAPDPRLGRESYRSEWRRDYARLIHSASFRRLQGKTQLFPSHETDFYRNRLTHSLEVAQIAKSIAIRINSTHSYFKKQPIDTDLVEFTGLAHDLGHPPFGHNGEAALDDLMLAHGGFEGNAQTLRILSRLEKKQTHLFPSKSDQPIPIIKGIDQRIGLNLTSRSLASILKYDKQIPRVRSVSGVRKGYYEDDQATVKRLKDDILGRGFRKRMKTIECSIMDIADDIAYSTYDLEDSFKAGFISPLDIIGANDTVKQRLSKDIKQKIDEEYPELRPSERSFDIDEFNTCALRIFDRVFELDPGTITRIKQGIQLEELNAILASRAFQTSSEIVENGYLRSELTSTLVGSFLRGTEVVDDKAYGHPQLQKARLSLEVFKEVEILKRFSYDALIMSPRLKVTEYRGKKIIAEIFKILTSRGGHLLMPTDWSNLYADIRGKSAKRRVVCDFIAGMTDRYCVEFYDRLTGSAPPSIHKPH